MGDDNPWDSADLERVEPTATSQDITPAGATPLDAVESDSGPYGQYTPLGEIAQLASVSRGVGRRGRLGLAFVWILVALVAFFAVLGTVNALTQEPDLAPTDISTDESP